VYLPSYTATIGIDFNSRMIRVDGSICKLEIWDTAGQERFSTITANYYRGAQGALLVYDIGAKESLLHVKSWFDRAKQLGGQDIECILIGNKSDVLDELRQVTWDEGDAVAAELGIPFMETSALNGSNVEAAFVAMTAAIKESVDRRGLSGVKTGKLQQAAGVTLASGDRAMTMREKCGCS
jgi:small GTP-binding protein